MGTGVATLGSGARGLAGNSGDGTQSHIAGKWEGPGGSGRGLEGAGVDRGAKSTTAVNQGAPAQDDTSDTR